MTEHDRDNVRYIAGAMSGTSADGVDIAITRIAGIGIDMTAQLVRHHHQPYSAALRKEIFAFRAGEVRDDVLPRLAKMGHEISQTYATAINDTLKAAGMNANQLAAVAAHGQTLYHGPPDTIQWFDPTIVAAEVGCPVVSDFRRADLAAGGQGAPLVPFADYILFRHPTKNRVLLNIGGIANITYLKAGGTLQEVIAFDTGPGNCNSDRLIRNASSGKIGFDAGGEIALRGSPSAAFVNAALQHPFFKKPPPKSTDVPEMWSEAFVLGFAAKKTHSTEDIMACACSLTARSIQLGLQLVGPVNEIITSGGGTKNAAIMQMLRQAVPGVTVITTAETGVSSDAKEAIAFALLGAATLDNVPSNVPSVTGAKGPVVLGSITPKP